MCHNFQRTSILQGGLYKINKVIEQMFLPLFLFFVQTFSVSHHAQFSPLHFNSLSNQPPYYWFEQPLDHFDPTEKTRWSQKYYHNDTYFVQGGPLFIAVGGEGPLGSWLTVNSNYIENARDFNADLYSIELRFYGDSHPRPNSTVDNLRWLTTEQILMDIVTFISSKKSHPDQLVVVFGCSYPGVLTTLLRTKFPGLVDLSISSSAPIEATSAFIGYDQVVSEALPSQCRNAIFQATRVIQNRTIPDGVLSPNITTYMNLFGCSHMAATTVNDGIALLYVLADMVATAVQYNEPPSHTYIQDMCQIFTSIQNPTDDQLVQLYKDYSDYVNGTFKMTCPDFDIRNLPDITLGSSASLRLWMYQSCNEFQFWQTGYPGSLRSELITTAWHTNNCDKNFPLGSSQWLENISTYTNIWTGGVNVTNELGSTSIHFTNGEKDPWRRLSVSQISRPLYQAIQATIIADGAHCWDTRPSKSSDSDSVKMARRKIRDAISNAISMKGKCSCSIHGICVSGTCYCYFGYTGTHCETFIVSSDTSDDPYLPFAIIMTVVITLASTALVSVLYIKVVKPRYFGRNTYSDIS